MQILVITNFYPPEFYGGYELLCSAAVAYWRRVGHSVHVLTSDARGTDPTPQHDESEVTRSLPIYWREGEIRSVGIRAAAQMERASRAIVTSLVRAVEPDVVSVWNLAALSTGILQYVDDEGIPCVCVIGDNWLTFAPSQDGWARRLLSPGRLARAARALVAATTNLSTDPRAGVPVVPLFASQYLAAAAANAGWCFQHTAVVAHGVDLDAFPVSGRSSADWNHRALIVSRLDPRKGVHAAIRALAHLPGLQLDVIGSGTDASERDLRRLVGQTGVDDRVVFHGAIPRPDVRERYLAADVLVFPSEWAEPFGIVPLEAMACGLPVVATGTGGSGEFLRHEENCLLFQPGNERALATAIERLSESGELRRRLVTNGVKTATALSQTRTMHNLTRWHLAAAERFASGVPR